MSSGQQHSKGECEKPWTWILIWGLSFPIVVVQPEPLRSYMGGRVWLSLLHSSIVTNEVIHPKEPYKLKENILGKALRSYHVLFGTEAGMLSLPLNVSWAESLSGFCAAF